MNQTGILTVAPEQDVPMKYLIFGLGNPGTEYANTRHNIGYLVLDALAGSMEIAFASDRYAGVARGKFRSHVLVLIKPTTFMNLSGKAVRYWMAREKVPLENILVVVDDIALPLGTLRLRSKGSDGGHNGLADIIYHLQTIEFPRLRFGIGDAFAKGTQVDYVLSKWTSQEQEALLPRLEMAIEAVKRFVVVGIERAMGEVNSKSHS